jgi:hypothetical protein
VYGRSPIQLGGYGHSPFRGGLKVWAQPVHIVSLYGYIRSYRYSSSLASAAPQKNMTAFNNAPSSVQSGHPGPVSECSSRPNRANLKRESEVPRDAQLHPESQRRTPPPLLLTASYIIIKNFRRLVLGWYFNAGSENRLQ